MLKLIFSLGGALAVPQGDDIIPVVNNWIRAATEKNIPIFASRDWHPVDHCSFKKQGGIWPTHCVQNTPGAKFHPSIQLPNNISIIDKATDAIQEAYSAFQGTISEKNIALEQELHRKNINRIWITGLALDYCVLESALDARERGFEVHLLLPGTKAIAANKVAQAIERLRQAGVIIEEEASPK